MIHKIHWRILMTAVLFFLIQNVFAIDADRNAVRKAYSDWCEAVGKAKGDAAVMVKFYAPDAILLPTLYPKILINRNGGLNDYFSKFTSKPNLQCQPKKIMTQIYEDVAINSGYYDFTYNDKDGNLKTVPCRFTFVYELKDKHWLIIEHHSSIKPDKEVI